MKFSSSSQEPRYLNLHAHWYVDTMQEYLARWTWIVSTTFCLFFEFRLLLLLLEFWDWLIDFLVPHLHFAFVSKVLEATHKWLWLLNSMDHFQSWNSLIIWILDWLRRCYEWTFTGWLKSSEYNCVWLIWCQVANLLTLFAFK